MFRKGFKMLLQEFEQWLKVIDHTQKTVINYVKDIELFFKWYKETTGEELRSSAFNEFVLTQYKSYMLTVQKLKPSSVNRKIQALRKFGCFLVAKGYLQTNPAENLKQVKDVRDNLAPVALSKQEVFKLRKTVYMYGKIRDIAIIELFLNTGLRLSEVAGLKIDDVEFGEHQGKLKVLGKGRKYREIPLNSDMRKILSQYLEKRKHIDCDFLFTTSTGKPLQPNSIYRLVKRYAERAGIELHPHMLRHTFAQTLIDKGTNVFDVKYLLGHEKLETTMRYKQPSREVQEKALENLYNS